MENNNIGKAFKHILYQFVYVLFIFPYHVWCKSIKRLATQRENKALKFSEINSQWPMFTFLKRWFIDFLFDMLIAIAWIVGIYLSFKLDSGEHAVLYLLISYYGVVAISWLRDIFIFILKPLSKFFSWLSKPAQHLDMTIDGVIGNFLGVKKASPMPPPVPMVEPPVEEIVVEASEGVSEEVIEEPTEKKTLKINPKYIIGGLIVVGLAALAIALLNKNDEPRPIIIEPSTEEVSAPVEAEPAEPIMPDVYTFPAYSGGSIGEEMANLVTDYGFAGTMDGMTLHEQFRDWHASSMGRLRQVKDSDNGYNYQFFFNSDDGRLSGIALSHYVDDPWGECATIDERLGTSDSNRMITMSNGAMVSPGHTGGKVYIYYFYPCAPDPNPAPRR